MAIDGMVDGLQRIVEAVHTTTADFAADFSGAGEIAGAQIVDSTSNGVSLVKGKTDSLEKTKLLKAAHSHHKYILRIVRFMMRNSLRNKWRIMVPGFAASLFVPQPVLQALRPAFALFGAHLGMEASEDTIELIKQKVAKPAPLAHVAGEIPDPDKVLEEKIPDKMTIRQVIQKAHEADKMTTFEITAAVLGSIDNLPIVEQVPIMAIYVAGMTAGVYGLTTALVKMEDWGQRLEAWEPRHPLNKVLVKTRLPSHVGNALQKATPRVFRIIPWSGAAAKFVTSGRVISHASPALEGMIEKAAHNAAHMSSLGIAGLATTMGAWCVTGIAAGLGMQAVDKVIYQPLKKKIQTSATVAKWKKAAHATLISTALMQDIKHTLPRLQEGHDKKPGIYAFPHPARSHVPSIHPLHLASSLS